MEEKTCFAVRGKKKGGGGEIESKWIDIAEAACLES